MKPMLKLSKDCEELSIVKDQIGTPTYTGDLDRAIVQIIDLKSQDFGMDHYSNLGEISWFKFAKAIFDERKIHILTKRPMYSVLDKAKIKNVFNLEIPF